jgi:hypothetical protein
MLRLIAKGPSSQGYTSAVLDWMRRSLATVLVPARAPLNSAFPSTYGHPCAPSLNSAFPSTYVPVVCTCT